MTAFIFGALTGGFVVYEIMIWPWRKFKAIIKKERM